MQQAFQSLMGAVLVNESVYMPVNHYLLPLMWNHRALFSELWVDPGRRAMAEELGAGTGIP